MSRKPSMSTRKEAARLAASIYAGCGDAVDSHRLFATTIMFEVYLAGGADKAAAALGWEVNHVSADVVPLQLVQNMADQSRRPGERKP